MTQNEPTTVGDYTEVECENDDCDRFVTVHVDEADEGYECWACNDDNHGSEGNATFPRTGDMA